MNKQIKTLLSIVIGLIVVSIILRLGFGIFGGWTNYGYGHHMFGGMFPLGMLGMGAFWLIVIILAIQWFSQDAKEDNQDEIKRLKRRLSDGDITIEEFDRLKEKLGE